MVGLSACLFALECWVREWVRPVNGAEFVAVGKGMGMIWSPFFLCMLYNPAVLGLVHSGNEGELLGGARSCFVFLACFSPSWKGRLTVAVCLFHPLHGGGAGMGTPKMHTNVPVLGTYPTSFSLLFFDWIN